MGKRIIIAGGGTGGHIFPAVAIANATRKARPDAEILFVGAKGKMEMEKVPLAGYKIEGIDIAGYNRSSLLKNIGLPLKLIKSFVQVSRIFRSFIPDAVIGVGGYSTFPVLRYAQSKGIPTFIHESNSFAGKSNIMLGKKATKIFVAGEGMQRFFPVDKIVITGNPIRKSIASRTMSREEAIKSFGLDPALKTALITGGSLGARTINETIENNIGRISESGLQIVWQTGKLFIQQARAAAQGREGIWTSDFISDMERAFAAADIVVSRSGAMAIAELCVVKKPVIFVPFPFAAEDHQTVNALKLVEKNAALMVRDADAPANLVNKIISLAANETLQRQLQNNIGTLAVLNADDVIANEILKTIND